MEESIQLPTHTFLIIISTIAVYINFSSLWFYRRKSGNGTLWWVLQQLHHGADTQRRETDLLHNYHLATFSPQIVNARGYPSFHFPSALPGLPHAFRSVKSIIQLRGFPTRSARSVPFREIVTTCVSVVLALRFRCICVAFPLHLRCASAAFALSFGRSWVGPPFALHLCWYICVAWAFFGKRLRPFVFHQSAALLFYV